MELSPAATKLQPGIYEHYKKQNYEVFFVARHTETLEEVVVYRSCYGNWDYWVRPLKMFLEEVTLENGERVPRFRFVGNQK